METPALRPDPPGPAARTARPEPPSTNEQGERPDFSVLLAQLARVPTEPVLTSGAPRPERPTFEAPSREVAEASPREDREDRPKTQEAPERRDRPTSAPEARANTPVKVETAGDGAEAQTAQRPARVDAPEARPGQAPVDGPRVGANEAPTPEVDAAKPVDKGPALAPVDRPDQAVTELAKGILRLQADGSGKGDSVPPSRSPEAVQASVDEQPRPDLQPGPARSGEAKKETLRPLAQPGVVQPPDDPGTSVDELGEALRMEDELADEEVRRMDRLDRQRAIDEARLRTLVRGPGDLAAGGGALGGQSGSPGGQGDSGFAGRAPLVLPKASASAAPMEAPAFTLPTETSTPEARRPTAPRARPVVQTVLQQAREMARERRLEQGKLNLSIRIDEATEVKLTITPRADGTHELAFLVADPKLREELQRAIPEIRDAATELPIDVADVWIGGVVDETPDREVIDPDIGERNE